MRRFGLILAAAIILTLMLALASSSWAQQLVHGLDADLTGEGESKFTTKGPALGPGGRPQDEDGSGSASDIEPATKAHIHEGTAEEAGPTVVKLDPPPEDRSSSGCTDVNGALLRDLLQKPQNYYVDVHNEEFPRGAIRGQLSLTEASEYSPACPGSVCP